MRVGLTWHDSTARWYATDTTDRSTLDGQMSDLTTGSQVKEGHSNMPEQDKPSRHDRPAQPAHGFSVDSCEDHIHVAIDDREWTMQPCDALALANRVGHAADAALDYEQSGNRNRKRVHDPSKP